MAEKKTAENETAAKPAVKKTAVKKTAAKKAAPKKAPAIKQALHPTYKWAATFHSNGWHDEAIGSFQILAMLCSTQAIVHDIAPTPYSAPLRPAPYLL